jgi:serine/threonine-protein kinase ATR
MARRGGGVRPTHSKPSNGITIINNDNLPPPSTIAAQIVHNRSHVARQEPENKALFGKLLQEYLKDPVVEEANIETNAQLIGVVAEAGIDVLLKEDPFAPDTLLQQANDSLLVIQLTIKRTPGVLLFCNNNDSAGKEKPPLILWLLPKVLSLLGRNHMDYIQESLCGFLAETVGAIRKTSHLWRSSCIISKVLRDIVEGKSLHAHSLLYAESSL